MPFGAWETGCFREMAALHSDHLRQVRLYFFLELAMLYLDHSSRGGGGAQEAKGAILCRTSHQSRKLLAKNNNINPVDRVSCLVLKKHVPDT